MPAPVLARSVRIEKHECERFDVEGVDLAVAVQVAAQARVALAAEALPPARRERITRRILLAERTGTAKGTLHIVGSRADTNATVPWGRKRGRAPGVPLIALLEPSDGPSKPGRVHVPRPCRPC